MSDDFIKCFKEKFPYSLTIVPCVPCMSDTNSFRLWPISFLYLLAYFAIKVIVYFAGRFGFSESLSITDWLNHDNNIVIYFFLGHALLISITTAWYLSENKSNKQKQSKSKSFTQLLLPSLGVGILLLISQFISLQFYYWLKYLPLVGSFILSILQFFEGYLGQNAPKIIMGWWGVPFSALLLLIPLIGPLLSGLSTFYPQNSFIMWLGYILVCAFN